MLRTFKSLIALTGAALIIQHYDPSLKPWWFYVGVGLFCSAIAGGE